MKSLRKVVLVTSLAAFALGLGVAAYPILAHGGTKGSGSQLPVSSLPSVDIDNAQAAAIGNSLGAAQLDTYGIDMSAPNLRRFSVGGGKAMDVILGSSGICLSLDGNASCASYAALEQSHYVSLFETPFNGPRLGGGITDASAQQITFGTKQAPDLGSVPVTNGTFALPSATEAVLARVGGTNPVTHGPAHLQITVK